jgi:hypothetical protein
MPFSTMIRKMAKEIDVAGKMVCSNVANHYNLVGWVILMFLRKEIAVIWKSSKLEAETSTFQLRSIFLFLAHA